MIQPKNVLQIFSVGRIKIVSVISVEFKNNNEAHNPMLRRICPEIANDVIFLRRPSFGMLRHVAVERTLFLVHRFLSP
jgi:hypothetical protein